MWVAKIKSTNEKHPIFKIAKEVGVIVYYYPLNYYTKGNRYYYIATGLVEGSEKQIKNFFRELKKLKKHSAKRRVLNHLETKENFFIAITSETKTKEAKESIKVFYNPALIHIKPNTIYPTLEQEEEIACMDRKVLEKTIKVAEKKQKGKLLSIKQERITNIGILSMLPKLTSKQKRAFYLAIENGYYEHPRKTNLLKLAKMMKVSFSTYRTHLRKAEKKILPFIGRKIGKDAI